ETTRRPESIPDLDVGANREEFPGQCWANSAPRHADSELQEKGWNDEMQELLHTPRDQRNLLHGLRRAGAPTHEGAGGALVGVLLWPGLWRHSPPQPRWLCPGAGRLRRGHRLPESVQVRIPAGAVADHVLYGDHAGELGPVYRAADRS